MGERAKRVRELKYVKCFTFILSASVLHVLFLLWVLPLTENILQLTNHFTTKQTL